MNWKYGELNNKQTETEALWPFAWVFIEFIWKFSSLSESYSFKQIKLASKTKKVKSKL
jgi:hypothetical protein